MYKSLIIAAILINLAFPAFSENIDVPSTLDAIPAAPATPDNQLELSLKAAYELALSRNLNLYISRYDLALADTSILARSGIFDPNFTAGLNSTSNESPTVSQLEGNQDVLQTAAKNFQLGYDQLLPTGATVSVTAGTRYSETNNQLYFLNPSYGTDLTANFRQPLLDGFGTTVNRSGIIIAQNNREQTGVAFEMQVIATLWEVEKSYWDYIKAGEAVAVSQQSLDLAERLLRETQERVKVGTSAPIDLVQSEAGVATRRQDLIVSRNAADNAEDILKSMLGFDQPAEWMAHIVATEKSETAFLDVDLREAIETALENRPEIEQKEIGLENSEHYIKVARNTVLPKLDLEASYGFSGIGGTTTIRDPDTGEIIEQIPGGLSDAMGQLGDFPHWTVGLNFVIPFGNNVADATLAQRRFEKERAEMDLNAEKQRIILGVRTAVRLLNDGAAAIDAAVASREFAVRNLEAEQTKFDNGLSTNYNVLQIQEDLSKAQLSEINARAVYRRAIVGYRYSTGTLLNSLDISILDPDAQEPAHTMWQDVEWMQFDDFKRDSKAEEAPVESE